LENAFDLYVKGLLPKFDTCTNLDVNGCDESVHGAPKMAEDAAKTIQAALSGPDGITGSKAIVMAFTLMSHIWCESISTHDNAIEQAIDMFTPWSSYEFEAKSSNSTLLVPFGMKLLNEYV
jgi:hypothetical protein